MSRLSPRSTLLLAALLVAPSAPAADKSGKAPDAPKPGWLGAELPLPLSVKTPEDLAFKAQAERQYLVFNLLAAGKVAWDRGDYATAATQWEALLRLPNLPGDIDLAVRPLATLARSKAGGAPSEPLPTPPPASSAGAGSTPAESGDAVRRALVQVQGTVSGGGPVGPGGTVVFLRRVDGPTPRPKPSRIRAVVQKDKRFIPHVIAVPQGSTVEFRNDDEIFHNVFSLSKPNDFDLGLYKGGLAKDQEFNTPGPVQLLCNIHASMQGWVYVVDTPYYAQADGTGKFSIRGVPPGQYALEAWHETSAKNARVLVAVKDGMESLNVTVDGDKVAPAFVPDKSGKPRQPQLGY